MADGAPPVSEALGLDELLAMVWNRVVGQVNKLLEAHAKFGYFKFQENLNPSLEDIIKGFEFVDFALNQLTDSGELGYEEYRNAINSQQCILKMKELAAACKNNAQDDYERVMQELTAQAKI